MLQLSICLYFKVKQDGDSPFLSPTNDRWLPRIPVIPFSGPLPSQTFGLSREKRAKAISQGFQQLALIFLNVFLELLFKLYYYYIILLLFIINSIFIRRLVPASQGLNIQFLRKANNGPCDPLWDCDKSFDTQHDYIETILSGPFYDCFSSVKHRYLYNIVSVFQ